jgi:hypothetical protein
VHDLFPSVQDQKGLETYRTGTKIFGYTPGTFGQPLELKKYPFKSCAKVPFALCTKAVQYIPGVEQYI